MELCISDSVAVAETAVGRIAEDYTRPQPACVIYRQCLWLVQGVHNHKAFVDT